MKYDVVKKNHPQKVFFRETAHFLSLPGDATEHIGGRRLEDRSVTSQFLNSSPHRAFDLLSMFLLFHFLLIQFANSFLCYIS